MAVFNEPTQWEHPLGNNADTSTLPDNAAATAGIASLQKLFQIINATPLEAGGIAPDREDVNALFKLLGDSIFYAMTGGIASYNATYDYPVGALVKYNNILYEAIQANGADSTVAAPTDSIYWSQIPTYADLVDLVPTGVVLPFGGSTVPNGWLLANGAAVSRASKARLFSVYGTTFGAGDGSTTFNLPDLRDRYIIGVNTNALGTQIAEQLPNIKGICNLRIADYINPLKDSGALKGAIGNYGGYAVSNSTFSTNTQIQFNANDSTATYVDNGHVYPLSLALNFIIKT
uniref:Baseplate wedge protein n=1 Tax=Siphoviridae sp. ctJ3t72 TaxID=2826240 RepID=A0A8S5QNL1_9CAUD|nr:MAG TPA: Baseplate wedge protein [Siphoviridae sp. ctJ3t72]